MIKNYTCEEIYDALIRADDTCCTAFYMPRHVRTSDRRDLLRGIEWLRACADNPYNEAQTALWNALQGATTMILEGRDSSPEGWQYARPGNDEDDILI